MVPALDDAAEVVVRKIQQSRKDATIAILPACGQAELLWSVEERLRSSQRVLRVSFPRGEDAALAALVDTAGGLSRELLDRVMPAGRATGRRWSDQLVEVEAALSNADEGTVLLVDEPRFEHRVEPGDELFAGRAIEMTAVLLRAHRGPKVLAVRDYPPTTIAPEVVPRLDERPRVPPTVQRLLTALSAAGVDVERIPPRDRRLETLITHDFARLCRDSTALRRTMARLAVLRVPFTDDWLEQAGFRALSPAEQRLIERLILSVHAGGLRMLPATFAEVVRAQLDREDPAWLPDEPPGEAHRDAARYHRGRYLQAVGRGDVATAAREELEEIHQLTEAGDAGTLLDRSLQFVEQYDALGRTLSRRALNAEKKKDPATGERLRLDAVSAYERALAHDLKDAYAHHYLAYNLDILGREPERVGREFTEAINLDRQHAWYHGRYICFLITRARMTEARAGWERALIDLSYAGVTQSSDYYRELHAQVARHLLARSQLSFAREVLDDVPEEERGPWWRALDQLRVCLEEDRDERLVFPPTQGLDKRWSASPHFPPPEGCDAAVSCWRPGRVVARDEDGVILHVGEPDGEVTRIATLCIDEDALEAWGVTMRELSFGTFVELIEYEDGTQQMGRWDPKSASFADIRDLPRLFPFPDRYLRRAPA